MRIAVSLLLIAETLLGPSLCCCQASSMNLLAMLGVSTRESANVPANHSCCKCKTEAKPATDGPTENSQRQECPCKSNRDNNPAVPATVTASLQHIAVNEALAAPTCLTISIAVHDAAGLTSPSAVLLQNTPFVTTEDLLRAHHLLRC